MADMVLAPLLGRHSGIAGPESILTMVVMGSGLAPRGAPRNDEVSVLSRREGAAVLFLGRGDHFEVLIRTRHRRTGREDIPLVLDLVGRQCGDRIHLMHQLMIGAAEIAL